MLMREQLTKGHSHVTNDTFSVVNPLNEILTTIAGSLSIFGTIVIFATFLFWHDLRTPSRKILVYLSIGDFLTAVVNVSGLWLTDKDYKRQTLYNDLCTVEGIVNIAAILSSFFWTVYLSCYLYLSICKGIRNNTEKKVMLVFHLTAWGVPLTIAGSAAAFQVAGRSGSDRQLSTVSDGWCWIDTTRSNNISNEELLMWMFIAGKGWEMLAYVAITVFYVKVKLFLKQEIYPHHGTPFLTLGSIEAARKADRKFTFIPIIFIILRLWGTIRFFIYVHCLLNTKDCRYTGTSKPLEYLAILHGIGDSSQGFANFVIFCVFTHKMRMKFKYWCSNIFPCCPAPIEQPTHIGYESTNILTDQSDER